VERHSGEAFRMEPTPQHREYWRRNLRVTALLLCLWFVVTFVVEYFARELAFDFFGWPFSFFMAAQGSLIVYVLIIGFYVRYMNRLDRRYDVYEREEQ
jgi:putative solute:sodium symporter small subunit